MAGAASKGDMRDKHLNVFLGKWTIDSQRRIVSFRRNWVVRQLDEIMLSKSLQEEEQ